jgi:isopenicillin-N epimerase
VPEKLQPPEPLRPDLRSEWLLDPRITFLNHGSFGAVPRCVFVEQTRWRLKIEGQPIELLGRRGQQLVEEAKRPVARWLGMQEENFGFVTNATEGVNAILRSLKFGPADELVTTTHVYHAVRQAMKYVAGQSGAAYREIEIPLPVRSSAQVEELVLAGLSSRTRLLVIDHITSPTAIVFPVERIATECARRGVEVLIDGAHAPGMRPLNVPQTGATYYAGNLHKWACAPKGSAFVWAHPDRRDAIHPLVVSHYLGEGFAREFSWQGTRDISSWLSVPRALEFMSELGWDRIMTHNHQMAAWAQQMLCESWDVEPISPIDGSMLGSMVTVPLPARFGLVNEAQTQALQQRLYDDYLLEVPLVRWGDRLLVRPCCQLYNTPEDYHRLADVVIKSELD